MVKKILIYYSFIVTTIMALMGFVGATSTPQFISAILFLPLALYFWFLVLPRKKKALKFSQKKPKSTRVTKVKRLPADKGVLDMDRRTFIKLIGSAGVTVFLFSIFTRRAHGAFFGSVPGPGTVSLKDTSGIQIDPAEEHPTDGYKIAELDDSVPAFYGFTDKDGPWFIMKEGSGGDYRYTKGSSDFNNVTTGWPNRASLTYDYFDVVF